MDDFTVICLNWRYFHQHMDIARASARFYYLNRFHLTQFPYYLSYIRFYLAVCFLPAILSVK